MFGIVPEPRWCRTFATVALTMFLVGGVLYGVMSIGFARQFPGEAEPYFYVLGPLAGGWMLAGIVGGWMMFARWINKKQLRTKVLCGVLFMVTFFVVTYVGIFCTPVMAVRCARFLRRQPASPAQLGEGVEIRRYTARDEGALFALMEREGEEWRDYWGPRGKPKYRRALVGSVTFLVFWQGRLCGFARCRHDDGFGVYVYDLLVDRAARGRGFGRLLMERAADEFPDEPAYVMSDVDGYYEKLGYAREGSIFRIG